VFRDCGGAPSDVLLVEHVQTLVGIGEGTRAGSLLDPVAVAVSFGAERLS